MNWIGMILGVGGVILGQALEGGSLMQLVQPTAALIVFGGTLGATILSATPKQFSEAIRSVKTVFLGAPHKHDELVKEIIQLAQLARREGILALERAVGNIKNPFFSSNLRHLVDGYDPAVVKEMMEDRIAKEEEERHGVAKVWETAAGFSPTIGIIGAVLGLIHVMSNLSDSSKLGEGIAVAFVATIYGVSAANLFLLPIANKLKSIIHHEMLEFELIYTGITAIQAGLNPRVVEDRLMNLMMDHGGGHEGGAGGGEAKAA
jgi:chemotaxis protein MotA